MNNKTKNIYKQNLGNIDYSPIVVLAAGGKGTRIQSLNSSLPKPMIPIAGKPILHWEIENLASQGFNDIIITISHMAETIITYFGDGSKFGCNISYYYETEPLGNAGALYKLWESERLTDSFLFLISDAIYSIDFKKFLSFHHEHDALASLFVHPNNHPYDSSLVLSDSDGRVYQWLNKEDDRLEFYPNSVNAGLQILTIKLLEQSRIKVTEIGVGRKIDLDRDVLKPLISTGKIWGYKSSEYCKDAGTPERFHLVERDIRNGLVNSKNFNSPQKAIFLDRDGTLNKYVGFLRNPADFELLPGVSEAIKNLNSLGWLVIIITNQPIIARGEVTIKQLTLIHNKLETLLGHEGAYIDGIYYCPHHPDKGYEGEVARLKIDCGCRKPKPGLIFKAAKDFNIDLECSWMVGDGERDVLAGINAGTHTALFTGSGTEFETLEETERKRLVATADMVCENLLEFANYISQL